MIDYRCRALCYVLFLAVTLAGWTAAFAGPATFPPGSQVSYFSDLEEKKLKYVEVRTPDDKHWYLDLRNDLRKEVWAVDPMKQRNEQAIPYIAIVYGDGTWTARAASEFSETKPGSESAIGARQAPVGAISIAVSNDADALT